MKTILVVERDDALRTSIQRLLHQHGFRVLTGVNGKQGLASVALIDIDLIICDMSLRTRDVRNMIDILRTNPVHARIPIIMIDAGQQPRRPLPNITYLDWPFSSEQLLAYTERLTGQMMVLE